MIKAAAVRKKCIPSLNKQTQIFLNEIKAKCLEAAKSGKYKITWQPKRDIGFWCNHLFYLKSEDKLRFAMSMYSGMMLIVLIRLNLN